MSFSRLLLRARVIISDEVDVKATLERNHSHRCANHSSAFIDELKITHYIRGCLHPSVEELQ